MNVKDDPLEWTPLFMAAAWGHKEVVELFIANGADVNAMDGGGKTGEELKISSEIKRQ